MHVKPILDVPNPLTVLADLAIPEPQLSDPEDPEAPAEDIKATLMDEEQKNPKSQVCKA